ncbi:MAG: hypothetical protein MUF86_14515 [Akkermansiaceae bacterium]|jgi:hypothetical protein|nr:hypothetical protein [Akkermansiaceae bacterium]
MIPIVTSQLTAHRCSTQRRVAKSLLLLPVIVCALASVSCQEQGPPMVDTTPLASLTDGLSRLRENAVQLARSDAREVISRFGQMGTRRLAAVG